MYSYSYSYAFVGLSPRMGICHYIYKAKDKANIQKQVKSMHPNVRLLHLIFQTNFLFLTYNSITKITFMCICCEGFSWTLSKDSTTLSIGLDLNGNWYGLDKKKALCHLFFTWRNFVNLFLQIFKLFKIELRDASALYFHP